MKIKSVHNEILIFDSGKMLKIKNNTLSIWPISLYPYNPFQGHIIDFNGVDMGIYQPEKVIITEAARSR